MSIEYPSWSELHYDRFKALKESGKLKPSDYGKINRYLKSITQHYNGAGSIGEIVSKISGLDKIGEVSDSSIELQDFIKKIPLMPNEFMTAFDTVSWKYTYISDNMEDVLNVKKEDFSLETLLGFHPDYKLVHAEDVCHWIRYAICAYIFKTLYEYDYDPFTNSYEVFFRLRKPNDDKYSVVHKKSFFSEIIDTECGSSSHVDVWNLSHKVQHFRKVSFAINIHNNIKDTEIHNDIIALINAWILGFKTKEIFIWNYFRKYQNVRLMIEKLNADLSFDEPYSLKSMNDFIYKLRKKIKRIYKREVNFEALDGQLKFEVSAVRSMELSDRLGLFDFSDSFYKRIITRLKNQVEEEF